MPEPAWLGRLMANPQDLAFAFGLEPTAAVEHLRAKGLQVTGGWRTVEASAHAKAFTVAQVTQLDVLQDIQDELVRAQKQGLTMQQFKDNLLPALTRKGWFAPSGEPVRVPDGTPPDPETGELATRKRLTPQRLDTIFRTNMQSSMMAGRYRELMVNVDRRPWFQYVAILDGRTRPAHRAMHGRVFRHDDGIWAVAWPPCGWRCRCRVRALDQADLDAQDIKPESSAGQLKKSTVPMPDGSTSTTWRYTPITGIPFAPDPGFAANPALLQAVDRLAVQRAHQVLPASEAANALRQVFTHDTRRAELQVFVSAAREARRPMGARIALGALDDSAALKLADAGLSFDQASLVSLEDRLVAGAKASRHSQAGDDLALEDWAGLARTVAYGELRWDARNQTLIYAAPALAPKGPRNWVRIAVRAGDQYHDVRHAALVRRADLNGYELLRKAEEK